MVDWSKAKQCACQHNDVNFKENSGLLLLSFNSELQSAWSLGSQKSNASSWLQFRVETREIWSIKAILRKWHAITGLHIGPIAFGCLGWILGLSWAQFFVAIGLFGFSISTNPNFGCRAIFGHLDFYTNLNYQICNISPKSHKKIFYLCIPLFFLYALD